MSNSNSGKKRYASVAVAQGWFVSRSLIEKIAVSAVIIYFIMFQFLVSAPNLYVSDAWAPSFFPLANMINLNIEWEFFSPDPGDIVYLKTIIKNKNQIIATEYMPPKVHPYFFESRYTRLSATMRYMAIDPVRLKTIYVPWVCRMHPEATDVEVVIDDYGFPSFDQVRSGERRLNDPHDNRPRTAAIESCHDTHAAPEATTDVTTKAAPDATTKAAPEATTKESLND